MTYTPLQDWLRRLHNPFAGLTFWTRDSAGRRMIASRHYPHLLCWSWSLRVIKPNRAHGAHHDGGVHLYRTNFGGWFVVGCFWLDWQKYRDVSLRNRAVQSGGSSHG